MAFTAETNMIVARDAALTMTGAISAERAIGVPPKNASGLPGDRKVVIDVQEAEARMGDLRLFILTRDRYVRTVLRDALSDHFGWVDSHSSLDSLLEGPQDAYQVGLLDHGVDAQLPRIRDHLQHARLAILVPTERDCLNMRRDDMPVLHYDVRLRFLMQQIAEVALGRPVSLTPDMPGTSPAATTRKPLMRAVTDGLKHTYEAEGRQEMPSKLASMLGRLRPSAS
jgi:hypothetical protein